MALRSKMLAQLNRATKAREALDGETISIGGTNYVGVFSALSDPYGIDEVGLNGRESLHATLRIDQFLDDPTLFDPSVDYSADLPAEGAVATVRGLKWLIQSPSVSHDSFRFKLTESRPRVGL